MSGSALIIDDHPLYRDALMQLLSAVGETGIRVANSAEEALRMSFVLAEPRIILLDFQLPGISGTEAIAAMLRRFPGVPIIAVSASEDRRDASAALRAGARHFISKAVSTEVLSEVIRRVIAGDCSSPPWITPAGAGAPEMDGNSPLTPRQLEILSLLHLPNKEIGLRLGLAEVTVKMHVSAIFRVLEVANRTQAMQAARNLAIQERKVAAGD
jgi:two-component system, NarL family, nitrate/nitrite response regulator NarL